MLFKSYNEYLLTALKDPVNAEEYWQSEMDKAGRFVSNPDSWRPSRDDKDRKQEAQRYIKYVQAETATTIAKAHGLFDEKFRLWCPWNQYGILITDVGTAYGHTFEYEKSIQDGIAVVTPKLIQCNRLNITDQGIECFWIQETSILKEAAGRIMERFNWMPEVPKQPVKEEQAKNLKCDRARTKSSDVWETQGTV